MYRYASLLRPLGCWVSLEIPFSIETPHEGDCDPFRPDWPAHDVLVTEEPLSKEKIQSLQLTDIQARYNQKSLYDILVKKDCHRLIKEELGDKIIEGKIKTEDQLERMIVKYNKYL